MDPARARGLRPAGHPVIREHLRDDQRDRAHVCPRHAGARIEVDAQLVGVLEVARSDRVRVQVDAAEVDDPRQRGRVRDDHLVRGATRGKGEFDRRDERGQRCGGAFLEEELAAGAVRKALERHRPIPHPAQGPVGDREVVVHEVQLGDPGIRKEELGGVADGHLLPVDLERDRFAACHEDRVG